MSCFVAPKVSLVRRFHCNNYDDSLCVRTCRSDAETGGGWEEEGSSHSLRQRRGHGVGPSPSDVASMRTAPSRRTMVTPLTTASGDGEEEEQRRGNRHRRTHIGVFENILSYLLLP